MSRMNLMEFRRWMEGFESGSNMGKKPTEDQWNTIKAKMFAESEPPPPPSPFQPAIGQPFQPGTGLGGIFGGIQPQG